MLGFSLSKILFTIAMVFAVLWVYRQFNRLTDGKQNSAGGTKKSERKPEAHPSSTGVEDLSACPACGAYVAAGSNPGCGRPVQDCPMQR